MIKKSHFIILSIVIIFAVIILFSFWQIRENMLLTKDLEKKRKMLQEAVLVSQQMEKLQQRIQALSQQEEVIKRRVPDNENQPLGLIRALVNFSREIGLKEFTAEIKGSAGQILKQEMKMPFGESKNPYAESYSDKSGMPQPSLQNKPREANIKETIIEINFMGDYRQVLDLLDRLNKLERITVVRGIDIERQKELLPLQKIFIQLIVYTF